MLKEEMDEMDMSSKLLFLRKLDMIHNTQQIISHLQAQDKAKHK